jgi:phage-related protein
MPEMASRVSKAKPHAPIVFLGDSKDVISAFPQDTKSVVGYAMFLAQTGERHPSAKPMKDNLRKVTEVRVDSADGNTYRVAYVANLGGRLYCLHAFTKKATKGIATPKRILDQIFRRLQLAMEIEKAGGPKA